MLLTQSTYKNFQYVVVLIVLIDVIQLCVASETVIPDAEKFDKFMQEYGKLTKEIRTGKKEPRYIVFSAIGGSGGLGDVISGAITGLVMAFLSNRALVIDIKPGKWSDYVHSPYCDTTVPEQWAPSSDLTKLDFIDSGASLGKLFTNGSLDQRWNSDIIKLEANQLSLIYLFANPVYIDKLASIGLGKYTESDVKKYSDKLHMFKGSYTIFDKVFGLLYRAIAVPNSSFQESLDDFWSANFGTGSVLGVHLRFGRTRNKQLWDGLYNIDISYFWNCVSSDEENYTAWFLAADYPEALAEASDVTRNRVISVDGPITHYDYLRNPRAQKPEGIRKIFMDHFLLERCDHFAIVYSGFSRFAIYRKNETICPTIVHGRGKNGVICNPRKRKRFFKEVPYYKLNNLQYS